MDTRDSCGKEEVRYGPSVKFEQQRAWAVEDIIVCGPALCREE
jgi:hypothetical protein